MKLSQANHMKGRLLWADSQYEQTPSRFLPGCHPRIERRRTDM